MKKKIIVVFSVFIAIILVLVIIVYNNSYKNDVYVENKTNNKNKVPGLISLMLETKAGSGIYNVSPDGIVPAKGMNLILKNQVVKMVVLFHIMKLQKK